MDGALEGAVGLCACKLVFSLLFLPSLAASHSPIAVCCCCLLVFTDFTLTAFLSFLYASPPWLAELIPLADVVAVRFLLFLSHTYALVLLLTTPLIAAETLTRLLWPRCAQTDSDGQRCHVGEGVPVEDGSPDGDKGERFSHAVRHLCCLSVWLAVALDVRWRWKLEEMWTAACLHETNSLTRCLPNLFSPTSSTASPCWMLAFLSLLLLLLAASAGLGRASRAPAQRAEKSEKLRVHHDAHSGWHGPVPPPPASAEPATPGMSASAAAPCVDPEKTESSCTVHRAGSWNSVQMSALHHGDFVLVSSECLSAGQEQERTKTGIRLTFITADHVDPPHRSQQGGGRQWGFPCPGVNVMVASVGVLCLFALPLYLSVNILLIRTVETLLELCIGYFLVSQTNTNNAPAPHHERLV